MKISTNKPPIWSDAKEAFKFDEARTVFTYGDTLYNPAGVIIPDHLMIHEMVHEGQQQGDENVAKIWWKRYIKDPQFRVEQELEAYGAQYAYICGIIKDKNARFRTLHQLAVDLAGPMYGKCISYTDAINKIRLSSKIDKFSTSDNGTGDIKINI